LRFRPSFFFSDHYLDFFFAVVVGEIKRLRPIFRNFSLVQRINLPAVVFFIA